MTKSKFKKLCCVVMAIVCLVSSTVIAVPVSAANYTVYDRVTEAEVSERLNYVINNVYPQNTRYGKYFDGGSTCYGFGKDVVYRIFGAYTTNRYRSFTYAGVSTSGMNLIDSCTSFSYENVQRLLSNAKVGDVLQFEDPKQHTMVIYSVNADSVTVYHSNWDGRDTVRLDTFGFGHFSGRNSRKLSLLRSNNYDTTGLSPNKINLYETASVTAKSSLTIRSQPDINSSVVGSLSSGAIVNVCNYPIYDASGYCWRKLVDGRGWVCASYLNIMSGISMASGNYRIQNANGKYLTQQTYPANGVNVLMHEDVTGQYIPECQIWNFQPLFYYTDSGAIAYRITPVLDSNYSLDSDLSNNEVLQLWQNYDTDAQYWIVEVRTDGSLRFLNNSTRLALDIYNASNENFADVITYPSHDGNNQKFYLVNP